MRGQKHGRIEERCNASKERCNASKECCTARHWRSDGGVVSEHPEKHES